eukprot:3110065-Pleurochrysis_carterae.AAC.2
MVRRYRHARSAREQMVKFMRRSPHHRKKRPDLNHGTSSRERSSVLRFHRSKQSNFGASAKDALVEHKSWRSH